MSTTNRTLASTPTVYFTTSSNGIFVDETELYAQLFEEAAKYVRDNIISGVIISMGFDYADFPNNLGMAVTFDSPTFAE